MSVAEMFVLERCLYQRDVCIKRDDCIKRDVCIIKEMCMMIRKVSYLIRRNSGVVYQFLTKNIQLSSA